MKCTVVIFDSNINDHESLMIKVWNSNTVSGPSNCLRGVAGAFAQEKKIGDIYIANLLNIPLENVAGIGPYMSNPI